MCVLLGVQCVHVCVFVCVCLCLCVRACVCVSKSTWSSFGKLEMSRYTRLPYKVPCAIGLSNTPDRTRSTGDPVDESRTAANRLLLAPPIWKRTPSLTVDGKKSLSNKTTTLSCRRKPAKLELGGCDHGSTTLYAGCSGLRNELNVP